MTPSQKQAIETLIGRSLTVQEESQINGHLTTGNFAAIAAMFAPKVVVYSRQITERGVRTTPVAPRHRYALLDTLRQASENVPAWFLPTLAALGVPEVDRAGMADDLQSAWYWLRDPDGVDIGSASVRSMLDIIAAAVPDAAPACLAVKQLAERQVPFTYLDVQNALENT
jgi:hypothetical protein